jgi:hypothetical protein
MNKTTYKDKVTFQESATTEHINTYVQEIEKNGGSITNRFPDMMARGFSYVLFYLISQATSN